MSTATIGWFARHELSLAWRDFSAMMTAGRPARAAGIIFGIAVFAGLMHLLANAIIAPMAEAGITVTKETLVSLTGGGFLLFTVMLSQAMESVTRAYYARADLDLILSSPASARRLFAVRTGAIALSSMLVACLIASPAVNVLALHLGSQWLAAYGVLAAMGAFAAALAVAVTIALFRLVGPKRTRLIAQILAGIVGAGFIIGIQAAAILSWGDMSRLSVFQSADLVAAAPGLESWVWLPARAAMGDLNALAMVALVGFGIFAATIATSSSSFGRHAIAAGGVSKGVTRTHRTGFDFRTSGQKQALRLKEWKLLRRDPWLLSQTLMQVLYLIPPALMLWLNYGDEAGIFIVIVPVLVTAAGQLAGGLAWLAISGEDAHDLVVTAPVPPRRVLMAKIEAVLIVISVIMAPLLVMIAISSLQMALITAAFTALAAGSSTAIQLWFRAQARRSMFRRRQVSSRVATLTEAFGSIMWAGTAALVASGTWLAIAPAILALITLLIAKLLAPKASGFR